MKGQEFIQQHFPMSIQNIAISLYNTNQYRKRHTGIYRSMKEYYEKCRSLSVEEIQREQQRKLADFLKHATTNSPWYAPYKGMALEDFPILEKKEVIENLDRIATIRENQAIVCLTGGTTGSSMKVLYSPRDMQERFALIDTFRETYGYRLGMKTAWFSGKHLLQERDLSRGTFYRDDYINRIRFFSTFHISHRNFDAYWKAFTDFAPEYIVGIPACVDDLCRMAIERNLQFKGRVKAFFSTAETVLDIQRENLKKVFGCPLIDQYASSEGAPFILQCPHGSLHIHPLSGIFEVVDEYMRPAREGEILVTSFTTYGTPLIRYRINDRIKLAPDDFRCRCGSCFPVVEYIDGRATEFVVSVDGVRIFIGNICNSTKGVEGIHCFQISQQSREEIIVKMVCSRKFDVIQELKFKNALRQRLGEDMSIIIEKVPEIPKERSGKFRILKNSLSL
jgi:phenylacetate-CoA ligase